MKTERRHELQTNELALWLAKRVEQIKPYTRVITLAAVLCVGLIVAWVLWSNHLHNQQAEAWDDFRRLASPETAMKRLEDKRRKVAKDYDEGQIPQQVLRDLQQEVQEEIHEEFIDLAKEHAGTPVGDWAALRVADAALRQGVNDLFEGDVTDARNQLGIAIEHFGVVVESTSDAMLRERAIFGLAKAYESRGRTDQQGSDKDDLELAKQNYEKLVAADSVFSPVARQQIKILENDEFYPWFLARVEDRNRPDRDTGTGTGGTGFDPFNPGGAGPAESGSDGSSSFNPLGLDGGSSDNSN